VDRLLQAPVLPRLSRTGRQPVTKSVRSYADILLYLELDRPNVVRRQLDAWRSLFDLLHPDVLVADYSPLAILAARARIPTVAFGCVFTVPCGANGRFPPFPPLPPSEIEDEIAVLVAANAALNELGEMPVSDLASAFSAPKTFPYGFVEIDPYASVRSDVLLPPVVEHCTTESGAGRDVAIFLSRALKNDPEVVQALTSLKLPLRIDGRDLEHQARYALEQSGARIDERLIDSENMAKSAAVVLSHGGLHTVIRALLAGVPQVILASSCENWFYAYVIERLGLGVGVGRRDQIRDAVHHVVSDSRYAERARSLAPDFRRRHVGDTIETVADRIFAINVG
jgi:hypothetical protein